MVSIIIPAYNEEGTIGDVVSSALKFSGGKEVIVVDDGSEDKTAQIARALGAKVITLAENQGKAGAMEAGVLAALSDVILFLDADVIGLTNEKLDKIVQPVLRGDKEMYVAIRARRTFWLNRILHIFPILGGERALTRELWNSVPKKHKKGFEIEIALNHAAKQTKKGMGFEIIYGLRHIIKEKKYGFFVGLARRLRMSYQVARISLAIYVAAPLKKTFAFPVAKIGKERL